VGVTVGGGWRVREAQRVCHCGHLQAALGVTSSRSTFVTGTRHYQTSPVAKALRAPVSPRHGCATLPPQRALLPHCTQFTQQLLFFQRFEDRLQILPCQECNLGQFAPSAVVALPATGLFCNAVAKFARMVPGFIQIA
jgi:hypothetical protein